MSDWRTRNFNSTNPLTQEIIYQMVDNNFPLSTEQFQQEIEINPLVKGKTKLVTKYKTRYIHINVDAYMTNDEIFNLGKRISIIEQSIIKKSKILCNNTINKNNPAKQFVEKLTDNQIAMLAIESIEKIIDNNNFALKHNESLTVKELSTKINSIIIDFKKQTEKFVKQIKKTKIY